VIADHEAARFLLPRELRSEGESVAGAAAGGVFEGAAQNAGSRRALLARGAAPRARLALCALERRAVRHSASRHLAAALCLVLVLIYSRLVQQ